MNTLKDKVLAVISDAANKFQVEVVFLEKDASDKKFIIQPAIEGCGPSKDLVTRFAYIIVTELNLKKIYNVSVKAFSCDGPKVDVVDCVNNKIHKIEVLL
jgi:hypothetical protein